MILESIASRVEAFVRTRFEVDPNDDDFDRSVDLYDRGYIDSVGFVDAIYFSTIVLTRSRSESEDSLTRRMWS